jgi:hypothetical protein
MNIDALALLDAAGSVLRDLAASQTGNARYSLLLSANAVATARRDLALRDRSETARIVIPADRAAIRSGACDGDISLYDHLVAFSTLRAWIADPSSVTDAERAAYVDGGSG